MFMLDDFCCGCLGFKAMTQKQFPQSTVCPGCLVFDGAAAERKGRVWNRRWGFRKPKVTDLKLSLLVQKSTLFNFWVSLNCWETESFTFLLRGFEQVLGIFVSLKQLPVATLSCAKKTEER